MFAAVIHRMDVDWQVGVRAALPDHPTLEAKLSFLCKSWGLHGYDVMAAHPDARDLFDLTFAAVREMYDHFQALTAEIIAPAVATFGLNATVAGLARTMAFFIRGFRETVVSRADTQRLVAIQVSLLVVALSAMPRPHPGS